jgi:hypothetical protein
MFADVADKPPTGALALRSGDDPGFQLAGTSASRPDAYKVRGLRLNMANNPKKVKDPTEVALSAIQEALNISDVSADTDRHSIGDELAPPTIPSSTPAYSDSPFDTRPSDRQSYDQIEEPRSPRRAANDDRETIG